MILQIPSIGEANTAATGVGKVITSLTLIETTFNAHDHTTEGASIPSAALNINADVPFNDNRLTTAQTIGFQSSASFPTPPRGNMLFVLSNDLWYNDGTNDIQLTSGGAGLPSADGFTDGYVNNVLGQGKAGYIVGSTLYRFTQGDAADALSSTLANAEANHITAARLISPEHTSAASIELDPTNSTTIKHGGGASEAIYLKGSTGGSVSKILIDAPATTGGPGSATGRRIGVYLNDATGPCEILGEGSASLRVGVDNVNDLLWVGNYSINHPVVMQGDDTAAIAGGYGISLECISTPILLRHRWDQFTISKGFGDSGTGSPVDTYGHIRLESSGVNQAVAKADIRTIPATFAPTGYGDISPATSITADQSLFISSSGTIYIDKNDTVQSGTIQPEDDNTYDLGDASKTWAKSFTGYNVTKDTSTTPTGQSGNDPHNRNTQNAVVARATFDATSGTPVIPTNHWNILSAANAGDDGFYTITLDEPIALDATVQVTVDGATLGATGPFDLYVATGTVTSTTTIDIRLTSIVGGVQTKLNAVFHMTVVGG
tara:strand:+ start:19372 stop:21015 length:1644 start_codon:yes stop_codon:yes gene_type:complete